MAPATVRRSDDALAQARHAPGPGEEHASTGCEGEAFREALDALRPLFRTLDELLSVAIARMEHWVGHAEGADPYRGLYLTADDVARSLERPLSEPTFPPSLPDTVEELGGGSPALLRLKADFGLSAFELGVLVIAAAPTLDPRYARAFAFLQDDVTRTRPRVDLVLDLLCRSVDEKLGRRAVFAADALLVREGLIELHDDSTRPDPSLLALEIRVTPAVGNFLAGAPGRDPRGVAAEGPVPAATGLSPLSASTRRSLVGQIRRAASRLNKSRKGRPASPGLRIVLQGPEGSGRLATARQVVRRGGLELTHLDLARVGAEEGELDRLVGHLLLECRLRRRAIYISGAEGVVARWGEPAARRIGAALAAHPGVVILGVPEGCRSCPLEEALARDAVRVPFPVASYRRREAAWRRSLRGRVPGKEVGAMARLLAERFDLNPIQITAAAGAALADGTPSRNGSRTGDRALPRLFAAARAGTGRELADQARSLEPAFVWDDLILPGDQKAQLREICHRVEHRRRVMDEWGFRARLPLGSGVNALFSGPSGTGKTMAAQVLAGELGLDVFRIDLSRVVSKYIGETEKNLSRVFEAAERTNAILFFDEADALFGKRSEVKDSHDRYANIEISYLLQKMEEYQGVTILATNLRQNMDDAFVRRLAFHIHFPVPGESDRARIWEGVFPADVPMGEDVDLEFMAERFRVTGGNIRNVAVASAFLAAADGGTVKMRHLMQGMKREFQKMGKVCVESDFEPYYHMIEGLDAPGRSQ